MKRFMCILTFSFCIFNFVLTQVPSDRDGLLKAEGMGQAKYAEMNGYPGPKHVLEVADELQLTAAQRTSVKAIFDEMASRAKDVGERIIDIEEELYMVFKNGIASEKALREQSEQIGRLRGKLRAIHLAAHLKTKKILTQAQVENYKKLRKQEAEHEH